MTDKKKPPGNESKLRLAGSGLQAVIDMFAVMDAPTRNRLLVDLGKRDADLVDKIRKKLLSFERLVEIDGRGIQLLLKELPQGKLALALRRASDELKSHLLSNLSTRAAANLRDEVDNLGPRRVTDVETAQAYVMEIAQRLKDEGKITFGP